MSGKGFWKSRFEEMKKRTSEVSNSLMRKKKLLRQYVSSSLQPDTFTPSLMNSRAAATTTATTTTTTTTSKTTTITMMITIVITIMITRIKQWQQNNDKTITLQQQQH